MKLVPTKLNRPAIDSRWIVRPRLLSSLDNAFGRKLTLISAPAGYGKTTLVAQWLDHIPHPSTWLSLDEHDSDPDRFLRYVIASIRKIFPQFGPQIDPLLSSPTLPPLEYLTDALISDLAEPVKPWVLVLDDFQFIGSKPLQEIRYHHLFHALLSSLLKTILPQSQQSEIHRRAGEWFAGQGFIEDGLRHLIATGDLDAAAELVVENMHAAIDQDLSRRTMGRWLDLFPKGSAKHRPELLLTHAFQKMFRWCQWRRENVRFKAL